MDPGRRSERCLAVAGAVALGFAGAGWLDVLTARLAPRALESVAEVTLLGCIGLVVGAALGLLWPGAWALTGRRLVGLAAGTCAALATAGAAFWLGGELGPGAMRTLTVAAFVVPPLALLLFASASAALPSTWSGTRVSPFLWAALLPVVALAAARDPELGPGWAVTLGCLAVAAVACALALLRPAHAVVDGALVLVLGLGFAWPDADRGAPAPASWSHAAPGSVVLLLLDTTRLDALSPYGGPAGETPVVERLAREGTTFEQVISPSPWTAPSHASMFTGLYPREHGVHHLSSPIHLADRFETTAERLQAAGYQTAAFSSNGWLAATNSLQGFEHVVEVNHQHRDHLILARLMRYTGLGWVRWVDRGSREATDAIADWLAGLDPDRPFFLFLNLFEAHNPYLPPVRDRDAGRWLQGIRATRGFHPVAWHSHPPEEGWRPEALRSLYRAGVRYQDRAIGRLLERMEGFTSLDEALLVVTSDHGDNLGAARRWGHQFELNDALVRVPLILRAPGRVPAGERVTDAYANLDLHDTLLDWAGLASEGGGLLPERRRARAATFAEWYPSVPLLGRIDPASGLSPRSWDTPVFAVRKDGFKLVVRRGGAKLYDLDADPEEAKDLADEQPERRADLERELEAWLEAHPGPGLGGGSPAAAESDGEALDPETRRQLEALGYL